MIGFASLLVIPGIVGSALLLYFVHWSLELKLLLLSLEFLASVLVAAALREKFVSPLRTLANVVGALREEDYSVRASLAVPNDALGELSLEVNALADLLAQHRSGAIEAAALLQRVVAEVDIPIFAFDPAGELRLANPAAEQLLQHPTSELLGKSALELGLQNAVTCENGTLVSLRSSGEARWLVRRSFFRQQGVPQTLIVLSDVSRALREEERRAWQRLIRVIGHELNNSLAPIKSIAGSLNARVSEMNLEAEQRQDFERGLDIIQSRAASLNRFLQAYRQLAQMPPPVRRECSVAETVRHVTSLENRIPISVIAGPDMSLMADPDQIEQMLINLLRNAVEAVLPPSSLENDGGSPTRDSQDLRPQITLTWAPVDSDVVFTIEDNGPGLMNPANVFVPFYTTKPQGSGIGLLISRQICEIHGGRLELSNRAAGSGCKVRIILPTAPPAPNVRV
jgi:two-component system nitrogen regulation sensor histidine kinase NtrY